MDFRSLGFLAIWTLISGPIFSLPPAPASSGKAAPKAVKSYKAYKAQKPPR